LLSRDRTVPIVVFDEKRPEDQWNIIAMREADREWRKPIRPDSLAHVIEKKRRFEEDHS